MGQSPTAAAPDKSRNGAAAAENEESDEPARGICEFGGGGGGDGGGGGGGGGFEMSDFDFDFDEDSEEHVWGLAVDDRKMAFGGGGGG